MHIKSCVIVTVRRLFSPLTLACTLVVIASSNFFFKQMLYTQLQRIMIDASAAFFTHRTTIPILMGCDAFGALIGNAYAGALCDRLGRRPVILWLLGCSICSDCLSMLACHYQSYSLFMVSGLLFGLSRALFSIGFSIATEYGKQHKCTPSTLSTLELGIGLSCLFMPFITHLTTPSTIASNSLLPLFCPLVLLYPVLATSAFLTRHLEQHTSSRASSTSFSTLFKAPFETVAAFQANPQVFRYTFTAFFIFMFMYAVFTTTASVIPLWRIPQSHFAQIISSHGFAIIVCALLLMPLTSRYCSHKQIAFGCITSFSLALVPTLFFKNSTSLALLYTTMSLCVPLILGNLRQQASQQIAPHFQNRCMSGFGIADTLGDLSASLFIIITQYMVSDWHFEPLLCILLMVSYCLLFINTPKHSRSNTLRAAQALN